MKYLVKTAQVLLLVLVMVVIGLNLKAEQYVKKNAKPEMDVKTIWRTNGTVTFQVTTSTNNGHYSPRNCFAIWVTDNSQNFIITLVRKADEYRQHLVKWNSMSNGNDDNAVITGATYTSHGTRSVTWDCKDRFGNVIPNGTYRIYVEFTEDNSANGNNPHGPWNYWTFVKSGEGFSDSPNDTQYFHNVNINYVPAPPTTIQILTPTAGTEISSLPFIVTYSVTSFSPQNGDGFVRAYVNTDLVTEQASLSPIVIDSIPEGNFAVTLKLVDADGNELNPPVYDTVYLISAVDNEDDVTAVQSTRIINNTPNPFNPTTTINFFVENDDEVSMRIFNIKGEVVKTFESQILPKGNHSITWNGIDDNGNAVTSGVYYCELKTNSRIDTKKMTLLK